MPGGRPTICKPENAEIARRACVVGALDFPGFAGNDCNDCKCAKTFGGLAFPAFPAFPPKMKGGAPGAWKFPAGKSSAQKALSGRSGA